MIALDDYEPTDADTIHIQSKALDEKAQTIRRLRIVITELLTACKNMAEAAYQEKDETLYCRFCGNFTYGRKPRHARTCPVRELEISIADAEGKEDG